MMRFNMSIFPLRLSLPRLDFAAARADVPLQYLGLEEKTACRHDCLAFVHALFNHKETVRLVAKRYFARLE
jgi:hypothetical protein